MHTNSETSEIIKQLHHHNHGSDAATVEVAKIKAATKRRAEETQEIPSQILNNAIQEVNQATLGRMPDKEAIRKMIQRARNELHMAPPAPLDLRSLVFPDTYRHYETANGEKELFLLGDTEGDRRILLFGRESHRMWSHQKESLFVDGTFRQAPPLFQQVYVILAKRGGFVFPVLYALLPDKRRQTYDSMFSLMKRLWPQLNPTNVSIDYETAAIAAVREAYPDTELFGCLFHLTKNLRRKLAETGLLRRYNNEPDFSLQARMVIALAFVPVADLDISFDELSNHLLEELQPILDWFEDYYLGRMNRNGRRRTAMFPSALWTVYDRVRNGQDRTNNYAEAAHRRLQAELDSDHASIWKFIDGLRRVQKGRDMAYEQYVRGSPPAEKRLKYKKADERIRLIVGDYANRNRLEYLRGIAYNFLME